MSNRNQRYTMSGPSDDHSWSSASCSETPSNLGSNVAQDQPHPTDSLPEGQPRSKRAERRARILYKHGSVSATDQPRGETRMNSGVLEWFDPKQAKFYRAAPLDDYRHQIISEDSGSGEYDHLPDQGLHEDDRTSFPLNDFLGQQHWDLKDRDAWDEITDEEGNQVMYLVEKPDRDIEPPNPGFMMYNNMIMLDPDDHAILDWPGIPRCFSSNTEGARIEALRRIYPWLSLPQFRARMPRWITRKTAGDQALFGLSSLQQRLTRFRELYDCPPWKKVHIDRGPTLIKHTRERLAREGLQANSTAGLRPLTRGEAQRRKAPYLGRCPENVGLYTLTEDELGKKAAKEAARHEVARTRQEEAQEASTLRDSSTGTKRKRDQATESYTEIHPTKKQARSGLHATIHTKQQASPLSAHSTTASKIAGSSSMTDTSPRKCSVQQEKVNQDAGQDLRWVVPKKFSEQLSIQAALTHTVADFKNYHSTKPPITTATSTYFEQYQEIQNHHKELWALEDKPAPQLIYIAQWFGSFKFVPLPDVDEERMKRLLPSHETSIEIEAKASSEQHHVSIDSAADGSSDLLSDWALDTNLSDLLEDGAWDGVFGRSETTSSDWGQSLTEEAANAEMALEDSSCDYLFNQSA